MSTPIDGDSELIVDGAGEPRRLGCLLPPAGFVSALPAFEDRVPLLKDTEIQDIAKSGVMDGRKKFDPSFIKDQKSHGSCNGFAGAMALTRARIRRGLDRVDLSGAYLYSLINGGRDQGSMLDDGMQAIQERGVATADTVGWDAIYPSRYDRAKADAEAKRFRGFECYAVKTPAGLFSAAALGFDLVVAVHVGNRFMKVDSEGVAGVDNGPGNHAVGADGIVWAKGGPHLTGFNSWNRTYGADGRMLMGWDHFAQPFEHHVFYAIRSTGDDAGGTNPPAAA